MHVERRRHAVRLEVAAMRDQDIVAGSGKLFDDCPPDESRAP
jgi:hypothetical protein